MKTLLSSAVGTSMPGSPTTDSHGTQILSMPSSQASPRKKSTLYLLHPPASGGPCRAQLMHACPGPHLRTSTVNPYVVVPWIQTKIFMQKSLKRFSHRTFSKCIAPAGKSERTNSSKAHVENCVAFLLTSYSKFT